MGRRQRDTKKMPGVPEQVWLPWSLKGCQCSGGGDTDVDEGGFGGPWFLLSFRPSPAMGFSAPDGDHRVERP